MLQFGYSFVDLTDTPAWIIQVRAPHSTSEAPWTPVAPRAKPTETFDQIFEALDENLIEAPTTRRPHFLQHSLTVCSPRPGQFAATPIAACSNAHAPTVTKDVFALPQISYVGFVISFCFIAVRRETIRENRSALWALLADQVANFLAEEVERMLEAGEHFDAKCPDTGRSLLHLAVRYGRVPIVAMLLARGADVNAREQNGDTPLHCATFRQHGVIAQMLLAKGADVNAAAKDGCTPLHRLATAWEGYDNWPSMSREACEGALVRAPGPEA